MTTDMHANEPKSPPRWQAIGPTERRVLGVLVEKAKTTPENYPLSLNALRNGCNQKNNRHPLTQLDEDAIEEGLEELRRLGAVSIIQGEGRVDKYRHLAYDWLGVDKVQLAVMAELLLRGQQTVGELRGRAARMEPIKDLGELQPVLDALSAKGLIQYLSPPGRGAVVTHALYLDREMDKVRREATASEPTDALRPSEHEPQSRQANTATTNCAPAHSTNREEIAGASTSELTQLRDELISLRRELEASRSEWQSTARQLRRELDELNQQLGN
jgi:uncharacterized protein